MQKSSPCGLVGPQAWVGGAPPGGNIGHLLAIHTPRRRDGVKAKQTLDNMSATVKWQLSAPARVCWARGGLGRLANQKQISGKRAHAPTNRDTWRFEDSGKPRIA